MSERKTKGPKDLQKLAIGSDHKSKAPHASSSTIPWPITGRELRKATITHSKNAAGGTTGAKLVKLRLENGSKHDASGNRIKGIFKTHNWKHEVAAYIVSNEAGFHLVPPTVETIHTFSGKRGSLQLLVHGAVHASKARRKHVALYRMQLMRAFDYVIGTTDLNRKGRRYKENYMCLAKEVLATDNGSSLSLKRKKRKASFYEDLNEANRQVLRSVKPKKH